MCKHCDDQKARQTEIADRARELRKSSGGKLPDLNAIFKPVGHDGPHGEILNPEVHDRG